MVHQGCYKLKEKQNFEEFLTSMNITEEAAVDYWNSHLEEHQLVFDENNGTWTQISKTGVQNFPIDKEYIVGK